MTEVLHGDSLDVLPTLPDASVDAVVTDPPYELGFMGKRWDSTGIAYRVDLWAECLRVLKPGGWLLAFGGTRTSHRLACAVEDAGFEIRDSIAWLYGSGFPKSKTCLKPAHEPIVVARKGSGSVLNIDACRIAGEPLPVFERFAGQRPRDEYRTGTGARTGAQETTGRWPANVVLDESQAEALDQQTGPLVAGGNKDMRDVPHWGGVDVVRKSVRNSTFTTYGDDGLGASRYYYVAKATRRERPEANGLRHPTVKPLNLMRWLVRLVTPPGGTVLDPFAGSGTTAEACLLEGFDCIAIEREADYLPLIAARLARHPDRLDIAI